MGAFLALLGGAPNGIEVAEAQAPDCSAATASASPESGTGTAFVDLGAGKTAAFVCITSPEFSGGRSQPITANGAQADGCYFVDGLGTAVVSVFPERADLRPDCAAFTKIEVGMAGTPATPTATPTTPPTGTATATPSATPTAPTPTPTPPIAPMPPNTGTGTAESSSDGAEVVILGAAGVVALSLGAAALATRRARR
jgi:hypothetical protein